MGRRPRGKKGKEIVAETDGSPRMQMHSFILSSTPQETATLPANHRYPTRRPNPVPNQCASSTNPLRYTLGNLTGSAKKSSITARRVLLETKDKPCQTRGDLPTLEKCTSEFPHANQVLSSPATSLSYSSPNAKRDKSEKNAGNSIFTESEDWSAPVSKEVLDVQNFTSTLLTQTERPENFHPVIPRMKSHGNLTDTNFHAKEELDVRTDIPDEKATSHIGRACQLSRSPSLNLTEIAQMFNDEFPDDEEVVSAFDPALVTIHGYRVKEEVAPLLRAVSVKYGDIAKDCTLESESPRARSLLLEMVCGICLKLGKTRFVDITSFELNGLLQDIYDLERTNMDVSWLHQKIDEISHVKRLLKDYPDLKKENTRNLEVIERKKEELAVLQQKILLAKDELEAMKTKAEESNKKVLDIKEKTIAVCQKSLLRGLL